MIGRDPRRDAGSATVGAYDRERAVERSKPVGKAAQAAAGAGVRASHPVVLDLDAQLIGMPLTRTIALVALAYLVTLVRASEMTKYAAPSTADG